MNTADKLKTAKAVTKFVVQRSTQFAVTSLINTYVPTQNKVQKAEVLVAGLVVGDLVGKAAGAHAASAFDGAIQAFEEFQQKYS